MPNITVRNSSIIVDDYEWGSSPRIEHSFVMFDMVTHTKYYIGLYYDKEKRSLCLPRGIDLWFVEKHIDHESITVDHNHDQYERIPDVYIRTLPRNDVQRESLRFMLGEGEYSENKMRSQLSLNLDTGKGKTYVSIATIAYERIRSIIITYSNGWLKQWKDRALEYTDLSPRDVYQISGAPAIDMILSGKSIHNNHHIYLVTHATINSYASTHGWDKITELFKVLKIGMKFYDEAHLNFANMCMIDFYTNSYRTYYITATPARSDDQENKIYQYYFKNVPSIELFDKEEDPHTSYVALMYNSRPTVYENHSIRNTYGLDINKYANYVVHKENFHMMLKIVMDMVFKMTNRESKALFFLHTNEAILYLRDWLVEHYPAMEDMIGIYTSANDDKLAAKSKRFILSTAKSAGAAEDIKGLKVCVVLAEPFKSKVIAKQILGRTRDDDTYLLELIDLGFYKIKQWYYNKLSAYQKYAIDTREILMRQVDIEDKAFAIDDARGRFTIKPMLKIKDASGCVTFNKDLIGNFYRDCATFRYPLV